MGVPVGSQNQHRQVLVSVPLPGNEVNYSQVVELVVVVRGVFMWFCVQVVRGCLLGLHSFWWPRRNATRLGQNTMWPESQAGAGSSD